MQQQPAQGSTEYISISDDLAQVLSSTAIAYEKISDGFGISPDGIETIVGRLQQTMPGVPITNGHILAVLIGELAHSVPAQLTENASLQQKIDQIARTYYTGSLWDLLESLAFCLRMIEIAYMNLLKKNYSVEGDENETPFARRAKREFLQQIANATLPACKLAAEGYPEAIQMIFRRFEQLGITREQAINLALEDNRSSMSPFTTERSLLEGET